MAIRGEQVQNPYWDDLSGKMTTDAERGALVCMPTGVSTGMDNSDKVWTTPVSPSGLRFGGILMHTVSGYDTSKVPFNFQDQHTVPTNSKVTVSREFRGRINNVYPVASATIVPGSPMYVGPNGTATVISGSGHLLAGRFESAVDSDGFVEVSVRI
jgi:hypothetical protein